MFILVLHSAPDGAELDMLKVYEWKFADRDDTLYLHNAKG